MPLAETWKKVKGSVVAIANPETIENGATSYHTFGSGVCLQEDGLIVTASRVIENHLKSKDLSFKIVFNHFLNSRGEFETVECSPLAAWLVPDADLAFIKIKPPLKLPLWR